MQHHQGGELAPLGADSHVVLSSVPSTSASRHGVRAQHSTILTSTQLYSVFDPLHHVKDGKARLLPDNHCSLQQPEASD